MARRYARNNAEAARLGIPTYYQAKRSKAAAERTGIPQRVLRGHARADEPSLRQRRRPMTLVSGGQVVAIRPTSARQASAIGAYNSALAHYLETGDDAGLRRFVWRTVQGYEYEVDLDTLDAMARAGQLSPEDIYPEGRP